MLPFTFHMRPVEAFAFLLGMLSVSIMFGDITSILFGVPGEPLAAAPARATASTAPTPVSPAPAPKPPERGYVVYVDSARVVIDLTNLDGLRPGAVLSLRRDRIPICIAHTLEGFYYSFPVLDQDGAKVGRHDGGV